MTGLNLVTTRIIINEILIFPKHGVEFGIYNTVKVEGLL